MAQGKHKQKKKHRKHNGNGPSQAELADKYELYLRSVQCPEAEVPFFDQVYLQAYGRTPRILREDFCGTAAVSCEWAKLGPERRAFGIDLDPEPLRWGAMHNLAPLPAEARERVKLIEGDVRRARSPKADVLAAQNFSFFYFKTRPEVIDYFRCVHRHLATRGVVVLDMFGGPDVMREDLRDKRKFKGFKYIWDQHRFDPITHHCTFFIHFRFDDGSELKRAFVYDWRLWSIPEVREMLDEAGFAHSEVYWEGTDENNEGNGVFSRQEHAESDLAWVAYVVGIK
jgi:SAM-dependent methyltransferase